MSAPKKTKNAPHASLRDRLLKHSERGAGGLLPIITVGLVVVIVAASLAASTSFASKISSEQISQVTQGIEAKSLLNSFVADAQRVGTPQVTATISGAGTYSTYYSTSTAKPSKITDAGVIKLTASGLPSTVRWLIADLATETSGKQVAVYSYFKKGGPTLDNSVNWSGTVKITDTHLGRAPGTQGPVSIAAKKNTASTAVQTFTLTGGSMAADIYTNYATEQTTINYATIRGNLASKTKVQLTGSPKILGSVTSGSTVTGTADIAGTRVSSSTSVPVAPAAYRSVQAQGVGSIVYLTGADCSTPAKLKSTLEAATTATTFLEAQVCATSSWNTEVSPKANLVISSEANLSINKLKVSGSKGTLGLHSKSNLTLSGVNYGAGASGIFLTGSSMTVTDSLLNGAISNYSPTASNLGTLDIARSSVLYAPLEAPVTCSTTTSCAPWASELTHLMRVS